MTWTILTLLPSSGKRYIHISLDLCKCAIASMADTSQGVYCPPQIPAGSLRIPEDSRTQYWVMYQPIFWVLWGYIPEDWRQAWVFLDRTSPRITANGMSHMMYEHVLRYITWYDASTSTGLLVIVSCVTCHVTLLSPPTTTTTMTADNNHNNINLQPQQRPQPQHQPRRWWCPNKQPSQNHWCCMDSLYACHINGDFYHNECPHGRTTRDNNDEGQ